MIKKCCQPLCNRIYGKDLLPTRKQAVVSNMTTIQRTYSHHHLNFLNFLRNTIILILSRGSPRINPPACAFTNQSSRRISLMVFSLYISSRKGHRVAAGREIGAVPADGRPEHPIGRTEGEGARQLPG